MKTQRSLNLLVAAAGLVFLSGCATETLTDSAFWSYLPFTSTKGGKGSGSHGGGPKASPDTKPDAKSADHPQLSTAPQRSTDPVSGSRNDPVTPNKDAGPATQAVKPKTADTGNAAQTPTLRDEAFNSKTKPTTDAFPVRTDMPKVLSKVPSTAPALPSIDGHSPDAKNTGTIVLPHPALGPTEASTNGPASLGDPAVPSQANRPGVTNPSLPEISEPTGKGKRAPLRLPELLVDGIGPVTVGKPTIAELPKRTALPQPGDSLNLPRKVLGEPAAAAPGQAPRRLPRAITDDPQRTAPQTASLPIPGIPADAPTSGSSQGPVTRSLPGQPNAATANSSGPAVAIPGAPATKTSDGRTLAGGVAGGPLPAKANGDPAPLPNVGQVPPLPTPPIPTPFRLSEWISNDALHQAWRRQQSRRAQVEPEIRGGEQQRLRLILDTYLLREKSEEKPEK